MDDSWSGLFQQNILLKIPVESLCSHYQDWNGHPTKELYSMMVGLMILQQMHDFTDDQAVEQFCFNIQWHSALNITNSSDTASFISHKSLCTMRSLMPTDETYNEIFDSSLQTLAKLFKADLNKQRINSVHVKSNMRNLGRIGLFVKTIKKFLTNLKRLHRNLFDQVAEDISPQIILADPLHGSDINCEKAFEEHDVIVIAPVMPGNQKKIPTGYSASFTPSICRECPVFKQCPVSKGKKAYYRYKNKDIRLAQRRQNESTSSFKDKYRFRAGVEATMSEFDRRTGVKHLRVRGMKAVCFTAVMKAIGLNILRPSRYRKQKIAPTMSRYGVILVFLAVCSLIKEQFLRRLREFVTVYLNFQSTGFSRLNIAV